MFSFPIDPSVYKLVLTCPVEIETLLEPERQPASELVHRHLNSFSITAF